MTLDSVVISQWIVSVCELFKGRLCDKPESSMPPEVAAAGGKVEHEIAMLEGGTLLLLVELKLYFKNLNDHIAQVLLELLCEVFFLLLSTRVLTSETRKPLTKRIATGIFIHTHLSTQF